MDQVFFDWINAKPGAGKLGSAEDFELSKLTSQDWKTIVHAAVTVMTGAISCN